MAGGKSTAAAKAAEVNRRGEITVPLDGELGLRPDFEAIEAIEAQLGSCRDLFVKANDNALTNQEAAIIVTELLRGYGRSHPDDARIAVYRDAKVKRIGALIYETGILAICPRLGVILLGAVTGGYTASGEMKTPAIKARSTHAGG